jgi:acyl-CoA thioesterase I
MMSSINRSLRHLASVCFLSVPLVLPVSAQPADAAPLDLPHVAWRVATHEPLRIIAFGSSSTQGIGASSPAASYPSRLQVELTRLLQGQNTVLVLNRGIGGEDADDMAVRLPRVIAEHPDLVIWQTGSNDPLRGVPLRRFEQETIAGIQQIRAANIDVMLIEPQLCLKLDEEFSSALYRQALRAIGQDMQVPVIRRHEMMRHWLADQVLTREQMLAPDGLHMTDGGYAKLAQAIAQDILSRIGSQHIAANPPNQG